MSKLAQEGYAQPSPRRYDGYGKTQIRRDMTTIRDYLRGVEAAMQRGDWATASELAMEASGVAGNIQDACAERADEGNTP